MLRLVAGAGLAGAGLVTLGACAADSSGAASAPPTGLPSGPEGAPTGAGGPPDGGGLGSGGQETSDAANGELPEETAEHGELAGLGALFSYHLRDNDDMFDLIARRLAQHELPRTPEHLGLTDEQFVAAVREAPATRPDPYTILEHLDLNEAAIRDRVKGFVERLA